MDEKSLIHQIISSTSFRLLRINPQLQSNDTTMPDSHYKYDKTTKFIYSRPEFLKLKSADEINVSADHVIRPIILPRDSSRLPWRSGYAECINAGKSPRNEDQAVCYQDVLVRRMSTLRSKRYPSETITIEDQIPWYYFGVFDGHAGPSVAVAAAAQLHEIIAAKLSQISDLLIELEFGIEENSLMECLEEKDEKTADTTIETEKVENGDVKEDLESNDNPPDVSPTQPAVKPVQVQPLSAEQISTLGGDPQMQHNTFKSRPKPTDPECSLPTMIELCRQNVTVDSLITGALESAFWEMDALIEHDKNNYKMPGGCTALVSLFILGKLYVCNAGDSRAIVCKNRQVIRMSNDFTPVTERKRILRIGFESPELLGTKYTHLQFARQPTRRDLGKQMLYRDAYMTGWSMKTITYDDLRIPLVWGEGKRSRVLATIGVTRGFGDQELKTSYGSLPIKPFLTPEPEVKVLPLESDDKVTSEDFLIMGSDGLWDVTDDSQAADIVERSFEFFASYEYLSSRFLTAAQDLIIHARGDSICRSRWKLPDGRWASLDDISVFVIPLKPYKDEYLEWRSLRTQARLRLKMNNGEF